MPGRFTHYCLEEGDEYFGEYLVELQLVRSATTLTIGSAACPAEVAAPCGALWRLMPRHHFMPVPVASVDTEIVVGATEHRLHYQHAAEMLSVPVRGRLRVSARALHFDADDWTIPIMTFRARAVIAAWQEGRAHAEAVNRTLAAATDREAARNSNTWPSPLAVAAADHELAQTLNFAGAETASRTIVFRVGKDAVIGQRRFGQYHPFVLDPSSFTSAYSVDAQTRRAAEVHICMTLMYAANVSDALSHCNMLMSTGAPDGDLVFPPCPLLMGVTALLRRELNPAPIASASREESDPSSAKAKFSKALSSFRGFLKEKIDSKPAPPEAPRAPATSLTSPAGLTSPTMQAVPRQPPIPATPSAAATRRKLRFLQMAKEATPFRVSSLLYGSEGETVKLELFVHRIAPFVRERGRILVSDRCVYFQPTFPIDADAAPIRSTGAAPVILSNTLIVLPISRLTLVERRRHLFQETAIEVFFARDDGLADPHESLYFNFDDVEGREACLALMRRTPALQPMLRATTLHHVQELWHRGVVSNFDYLIFVNAVAGRTRQDLAQYPVFPWVLAAMEAAVVDVENAAAFRDLAKPVGALEPKRLQRFLARAEEMRSIALDAAPSTDLASGSYEPAPRGGDSVLNRLRERTDRLMADAFGSESPSRRHTDLNDRAAGNSSFGAGTVSPSQATRRGGSIDPVHAAACTEQQAPFLYGSFYSTAAYVVYFMLRAAPQWMLVLQGGRWDKPQRLFDSVPAAFASAMSGPTDVKELIPEFYEIPADAPSWRHVFGPHAGEFEASRQGASCGAFLSLRECVTQQRRSLGSAAGDDADALALFDFGTKDDGSRVRDDVELPPWAASNMDQPFRHFVLEHRRALESDYASRHLHEWIDLVFGFKQRGAAAWAAHNVFHPQCYETDVVMPAGDDDEADDATAAHRQHFGQVPRQVFFEPHPRRRCADSGAPRNTVPLNVALHQACAVASSPLPSDSPVDFAAVDHQMQSATPDSAAVAIPAVETLRVATTNSSPPSEGGCEWDDLAPSSALVPVASAPELTPEDVRGAEQLDILMLDASTVGAVFAHGPLLHVRVAGCEDHCDMREIFGAGFTAASALRALHFPQETAVMVVSPAGEVAAGVWTPLIGWRVYHCETRVAVARTAANSLCAAPSVEVAPHGRSVVPVVFCGAHVAAIVTSRDATGTITIRVDQVLCDAHAAGGAGNVWCRPLGERAASFVSLTEGNTLAAALAITQDDGTVVWLPRRFALPAAIERVAAVWSRLPVAGASTRPPRGPAELLLEWFDLAAPQGIVTCRRRVTRRHAAAKANSSSDSDTDTETEEDGLLQLEVVSVAADANRGCLTCTFATPSVASTGDESNELPPLVTIAREKRGMRVDLVGGGSVERVAASLGDDFRLWCVWPFVAYVTADNALAFLRIET